MIFALTVCAGIVLFGLQSCGAEAAPVPSGLRSNQEAVVTDEQLTTEWPFDRAAAIRLQHDAAQLDGVPVRGLLRLSDDLGVEMVYVPPGVFPMGDPQGKDSPQRTVKLTKGFYVNASELTWRQYLALVQYQEMGNRRSLAEESDRDPQRLDWVAHVPHDLAVLLTQKLKGRGFSARLITEAEWEYACRAGTMRRFGEWDTIDDTKAAVSLWFDANGKYVSNEEKGFTRRPRQFAPNAWGIYDMIGTIPEWCIDSYLENQDLPLGPLIDPVIWRPSSLFFVRRDGDGTGSVFARDGDANANSCAVRFVVMIDEHAKQAIVPIDAAPVGNEE